MVGSLTPLQRYRQCIQQPQPTVPVLDEVTRTNNREGSITINRLESLNFPKLRKNRLSYSLS